MKRKPKAKTLTEEIFRTSAPYDNEYQGRDPRILFVCSAGLLRSATAANLFARKGWNTRSCGSSEYALIPISANLIYWAHKIFFMNKKNMDEALKTFKDHRDLLDMIAKKSVTLTIPDNFGYNNPELVKHLEGKVIYVQT